MFDVWNQKGQFTKHATSINLNLNDDLFQKSHLHLWHHPPTCRLVAKGGFRAARLLCFPHFTLLQGTGGLRNGHWLFEQIDSTGWSSCCELSKIFIFSVWRARKPREVHCSRLLTATTRPTKKFWESWRNSTRPCFSVAPLDSSSRHPSTRSFA